MHGISPMASAIVSAFSVFFVFSSCVFPAFVAVCSFWTAAVGLFKGDMATKEGDP